MTLKAIELSGFKSFAKKTRLEFLAPITSIVGPNGSGKSNIVEAIRFVLGEQSIKSLRGKGGTDLIFKGSKNLSPQSHATVTIIFDNSKRIFSFAGREDAPSMDFNDVVISREVFQDGTNSYKINNSDVRLRDIIELLASVHIGASGYHIISQGEADRILSANNKDRRAMIEDALGLKIYQYKIKESERKLEKTAENIKEVEALRREIGPHITFLSKQVEKIKKAEALRTELKEYYTSFLKYESQALTKEKEELKKLQKSHETQEEEYQEKIKKVEHKKQNSEVVILNNQILENEKILLVFIQKKEECSRSLGRIEGMIEALAETGSTTTLDHKPKVIPIRDIEVLIQALDNDINESLKGQTIEVLSKSLISIKSRLLEFLNKIKISPTDINTPRIDTNKQEELKRTRLGIQADLEKVTGQEEQYRKTITALKHALESKRTEERNEERHYYELREKYQALESEKNFRLRRDGELQRRMDTFDSMLTEAKVLVGPDIIHFLNASLEGIENSGDLQKKIERIKIKLEDIGGGSGGDVIQEYEEATSRDQFLQKELTDLRVSTESLADLITDLKQTLDNKFKEGIKKINTEFTKFFSLMFGGGNALLSVTVEHKRAYQENDDTIPEEELVFEQGIEINVSLPHKKVKELHMLSGGERSLTSIALLFAMSQVNPPPFLVLDETDAALDEANSRKYGDMLESLAHYSQLIVVTHNRETMSRASILYGITIGSDGSSKLLSIKLDEAVKIAK